MCMARYFESAFDQNQRMDEFIFIEKDKFRKDLEKTSSAEIWKNEDYHYIIRGNYDKTQLKSEDCIEKLVDFEYDKKYNNDASLLEKHNHLLNDIAKTIIKTSSRFDIDQAGSVSANDDFIRENVIQKTLEKDSLIFVEGFRPHS